MANNSASGLSGEILASLHDKNIKELSDLAKSIGLKGLSGLKKQTIIDRIYSFSSSNGSETAQASPQPEPTPEPMSTPPIAQEAPVLPSFSFREVPKDEMHGSEESAASDLKRKKKLSAYKKATPVQPGLFSEEHLVEPVETPPSLSTPVEAIELPEKTVLRHEKYRRKPRATDVVSETPVSEPVVEKKEEIAPVAPEVQENQDQDSSENRVPGKKQRFRRREKLNPELIATEEFEDVPAVAVVPVEPEPIERPQGRNQRNTPGQGPRGNRNARPNEQSGQEIGDGNAPQEAQPQRNDRNRDNQNGNVNPNQRQQNPNQRQQNPNQRQQNPNQQNPNQRQQNPNQQNSNQQNPQNQQPQQPAGPRPEPWAQYNIPESTEMDLKKRVAELNPKIGSLFFAEGVLEIMPDRFGILRSLNYYYQQGPDDIYVSPTIINRFKLRQGDSVVAICRAPKVGERYFGVVKVEGVNGLVPQPNEFRKNFDELLPIYPDVRIKLEHQRSEYVTRLIDLFAPIGRGQRGMIVAQPKTGKTTILRRIANAVHTNHPEMKILVLLVDERPEEVTEMERTAPGAEVSASTFDMKPESHVALAELVFEKAKRLVEAGHHVLILLDSLTRLARAYNATAGNNGRTMSGGIDSQALKKPRQLFSSARNIENGGSLTIIATALVDTGSRMDDVIFEEFKGTGNNEIVLDRRLANSRIFPALDVFKSGTRREDLFVKEEEREKVTLLRRYLAVMTPVEAMEFLLDKIKNSRDNMEFLLNMNREGR